MLMGKLYNLFSKKVFSSKKVFISVIILTSLFIKYLIVNILSLISKKAVIIKKILELKIKLFIEKLNISLDAKEVTYIKRTNIPPKKIRNNT